MLLRVGAVGLAGSQLVHSRDGILHMSVKRDQRTGCPVQDVNRIDFLWQSSACVFLQTTTVPRLENAQTDRQGLQS
jgi:hypothetical protein